MLGFLKRKKKDKGDPPKKENLREIENGDPKSSKDEPVKKKRFPIKLIVIILVVLIVVGISGFVVYKLWFSAESKEKDEARIYQKQELSYISLPEEMVVFSFDHFPQLYDAFVTFNSEMILLEQEIDRIEKIAQLYPDQKKIAEKEKKTWVKAKETLNKSFIKIEKPVKETYVLFRVNEGQGLVQVEEKRKDLFDAAQSALAPAQEMTQKLKLGKKVPGGLIQGTIYKLKKKFL